MRVPRRNPRPRTPGSLGNRTDLTASNLPTGQPYGARTDQARALALAPAQPTPTPTPSPMGAPPDPIAAATAQPFSPIGLGEPTQRPAEPVTAGLPIGAGPGPQILGTPTGGPDDQVLFNLYHAYQVAPSEGLRSLIEQMESLRGRTR